MWKKLIKRIRPARLLYQRKKPSHMEVTPLPAYEESLELLERIRPDQGQSALSSGRRLEKLSEKRTLDIIVPAYNMECYIEECIDSLLNQETDCDYRVIVIDDGSTDQTAEILKKYERNPKICLYRQSNAGQASARNAGLALSHADYIMFVDSDDRLDKKAVKNLITCSRRTDADIVSGSYFNFNDGGGFRRIHRQKSGILTSVNQMNGHPCEKVYRSSLWEKITFPQGYWFEDSVLHHLIFPEAKKLAGISDIVYERRITPGSITQSQEGNPKSIDTIWVTLRLLQDRKQLGIKADEDYLNYMLTMAALSKHRLDYHDESIQKAAFRVFMEIFQKELGDIHARSYADQELEESIREGRFEQFILACEYLT